MIHVNATELVTAIFVLFGICGTLIKLIWDQLRDSQKELKAVVEELKKEVKTVHHLGAQLQIYIRIVEDLEIKHTELRAEMKRLRR